MSLNRNLFSIGCVEATLLLVKLFDNHHHIVKHTKRL